MAAARFDLDWREGTYAEFSAFCADADVGCAGEVDCEAEGVAVEDYDDGFLSSSCGVSLLVHGDGLRLFKYVWRLCVTWLWNAPTLLAPFDGTDTLLIF